MIGKFKSEAFESIHSSAEALMKIGAIDKATMREFDEVCIENTFEIDLLTTCGTFNPDDCVSHEDFRHLFNKSNSWEEWMLSQIEQEGVDKYKAWYARMNSRCDLHGDLIEAHNKLFGEVN